MKKYLFIIILCSFYITGCDKETNNLAPVTEQEQFDKLILDLEEYNKNFIFESETRGSGKGWAIVCADVTGTLKGGLVQGAVSSLKAAFKNMVINGTSINYSTQKMIFTNDLATGAIHNQVCQEILDTHLDFLLDNRFDTNIVTDMAYDKLISYGETIEENKSEVVIASDLYSASVNIYSIALHRMDCKRIYPTLSNEIDITHNYIESSLTLANPTELRSYTEGYLTTISNSGISANSIKILTSSIAVGANSMILWEE